MTILDWIIGILIVCAIIVGISLFFDGHAFIIILEISFFICLARSLYICFNLLFKKNTKVKLADKIFVGVFVFLIGSFFIAIRF